MAKARKRPASGGDAKHRVLIVDDHPIVRQGLKRLIDEQKDMEVCALAESVQEALSCLSSCSPGIVIVDISLGSESGLELTKSIKSREPDLPILVLSMHSESVYAERALRAGASGYVMKSQDYAEILAAVRRVLKGEVSVSHDVAKRLLSSYVRGGPSSSGSPGEVLSDRELEVFTLLGRGLGTKQIANAMHLSSKTIETYREKIKSKLGLGNAVELMQRSFQWVQRDEGAGR